MNVETMLLGRIALLASILEASGRGRLGWAVEREQGRDSAPWITRGGRLRLERLLRRERCGGSYVATAPKTVAESSS